MRSGRIALAVLALAALAAPSSARAATVRFGMGADYWAWHPEGTFELLLSVDAPVTRHLSLGGRAGGLVTTGAATFGVPLDIRLRVHASRVYFDGMAGPWLVFRQDPVRAHVAFGFGLEASWVDLGFEVGWLDPRPMVGARIAFRL